MSIVINCDFKAMLLKCQHHAASGYLGGVMGKTCIRPRLLLGAPTKLFKYDPQSHSMKPYTRKFNAAASISFEIWGSWIRVKKFSFFQANFRKILIFSRQFYKKNRFFKANFRISSFSVYPDKIDHLQLLLGKLFYFSSNFTTFEHISCRPT